MRRPLFLCFCFTIAVSEAGRLQEGVRLTMAWLCARFCASLQDIVDIRFGVLLIALL